MEAEQLGSSASKYSTPDGVFWPLWGLSTHTSTTPTPQAEDSLWDIMHHVILCVSLYILILSFIESRLALASS